MRRNWKRRQGLSRHINSWQNKSRHNNSNKILKGWGNAVTQWKLLAGATILLSIAAAGPSWAQYQPKQTVEFVVHGGPGSGNDAFGRAIVSIIEQEKLAPVRFQIANRVGGGGATAASYIVGKKGDPNVIGLYTSVWVSNPLVQPEADAKVSNMTSIARLILEPAIVAVRAESPYKTFKEWIADAKVKPMKQSGGSTLARDALVQQLLMQNTGAKWVYISFPSGGERVAALLGGHVDLLILEPSEAGELLRAGKLRALAQISEKRLPGFEQVPTLKEAGFDITDVPQARGIIGPPGMPAEAVKYFEDLMQRVTKTPSWDKYLKDTTVEGAFLNGKDNAAFITQYETQLRTIIQGAGMKTVR
jgi:putative tricarboxylic transport membrane protein